jgi:hypothetical protein
MGMLPGGSAEERRQLAAGASKGGDVQEGEVEIEDADEPADGNEGERGNVPEGDLLAQFERLEQRDSH